MQQSSISSASENDKDPELWKLAQRRASFKRHLVTYIIMNTFFWIVWLLTKQPHSEYHHATDIPWPLWSMFGWGIGLFFHFKGAYVYPKNNSVEREYEKLKNKNS